MELPMISDTIKKGFTLYPRYMAYSDDDYKDVAAVLKKMHLNYDVKGNRLIKEVIRA